MNWYFYLDEKEIPIKLQAKKRPSQRQYKRTWIVHELIDNAWSMACFPEVTWGVLKKLTYVGKVSV